MTTQSLQKLNERLKMMVGKPYLVNAVQQTVLSYQLAEPRLTVVTDKKWHTVDLQNAHRLLELFMEVDPTSETEDPSTGLPAAGALSPALPVPTTMQIGTQLREILLDNIKKVQDNKDYIPQAQEVASQIKTIIDLAKTEVDYLRIVHKR